MKVSADHNFQRYYSLMRTAGKLYAANPANKKTKHMNLSDEDVLNLLQSLNKHKVKYLLVGGMAVVFHGYVRTTQDMDIWVKNDVSGMKEILMELACPEAKIKYNLGFFKQADFEVCYKRSVKANFESVPFNVIHIKDLLAEKKANNRTKDKLDIEELENLTGIKNNLHQSKNKKNN